MSKKIKMEILTKLPMRGKLINWKETVGITIEVNHEEHGNVSFKVVDYISKEQRVFLDYNGYVLEDGVLTGSFQNGRLGRVMNITNSSKNTFHLDENNILHIYGKNKHGKWEALYSGNHVKEVMNSSWGVGNRNIRTGNYNFQGSPKYLHHVDIKPKPNMVIDHVSNEFNLVDKFYDNRIENLREVTRTENTKNKNCANKWGYTGLNKEYKGWLSQFSYNGLQISTKTKHDLNEATLDNLIAQKYLGYKHQEEEFYKLDELSEERIKEVTDLLDEKMKKVDNKIHETKEYNYNIEEKDNYYILKKNGYEMLFDCDLEYVRCKYVRHFIQQNGVYWLATYVKNNKKMISRFHRDVLGFESNEYKEYKIHIDHLNNNPSDNRFSNLIITTVYSNQCNKVGVGYIQKESGGYEVRYMKSYKFWNSIRGVKTPVFKTEQEAIQEVERRKAIIENARVKLKSKQELDELIQYCLDNKYIKKNGLADLDLGYLYWKGIIKTEEVPNQQNNVI